MRATFPLLVIAAAVTAGDKKDDQAAADLKRLAGTWQAVAAEEASVSPPAEELKKLRLVFDGDKFTAYHGDMVLMAGTVTLDPTAKPKAIDLKSSEGRFAGKTGLGIYELDRDKLKLCLVEPGEKRPTEFKTEKQGQHVMQYERVKK